MSNERTIYKFTLDGKRLQAEYCGAECWHVYLRPRGRRTWGNFMAIMAAENTPVEKLQELINEREILWAAKLEKMKSGEIVRIVG